MKEAILIMDVRLFLNFDGYTEQAFGLYEKVFGTKIKSIFKIKDSPMKEDYSPQEQEMVLWAEMEIGNFVIYGEDSGCFNTVGELTQPQRGSYPRQFISLGLGSREEVDRVFSSLAEGGIVVRPLGKVFFCEYYGRIVDRFGVAWELMI